MISLLLAILVGAAPSPASEEQLRPTVAVHFLGSKEEGAPSPQIHSEPVLVDWPDFSDKKSDWEAAIKDKVFNTAAVHEFDYVQGGLSTAGGFESGSGSLLGDGAKIAGLEELVSDSHMKNALRKIPQGDVYAFLIGIESVSPLLGSAIKQVQSWSNQINATHIAASEIAISTLPGIGPKNERASAYLCEQILAPRMDRITAKHLCRDPKERTKVMKAAQDKKWILAGNYNIAKRIFDGKKNQVLRLNVTGTIDVKEVDEIAVFPPLHRELIGLLHLGRPIKGYQFIDDKVELKEITLKDLNWKQSEKAKYYDLLKSIQNKLIDEKEEFTEEEHKFLRSAYLPIGSLITLLTQYKGSGSLLALERLADLFAFNQVMGIVEETAKDALMQAEAWRSAQTSGYALDEYIKQVQFVLQDLQTLKQDHRQEMAEKKQAFESMIQLDEYLRSKQRNMG